MVEYKGYCVRCKKSVDLINAKVSKSKNGVYIAKGDCNDCDGGVCRILGKNYKK